ncbi:MAG: pteridine reductase [Gammaproteobacteria bacterium]
MVTEAKVVLVTGAARRIGAAIARLLHQQGWNIVLHYYQSAHEAHQLATELNQQRASSVVLFNANLADTSQLVQQLQSSEAYWFDGRLDAIVNNASLFNKTELNSDNLAMQLAQWQTLFTVNAQAPFVLANLLAPRLGRSHGVIVNITDIHAHHALRDYSIYCLSKAALAMQTQVLAKELAPDIRVNAVAPGAMDWPEGNNQLNLEQQQKIIAKTALKRHGQPLYIAQAVSYLLNQADFVTGQTLVVDGGRTIT